MDAVDFLEVKARMCKGTGCMGCEIGSRKNGKNMDCLEFTHTFPEDATKIVEEWGKEHPVVTNLMHVAEGFRKIGYKVDEEYMRKYYCPPHLANRFYSEEKCGHPWECTSCQKWWDEEWKGEYCCDK